ncbi:hypothetical protein PEX1_066460 [Penicillium expansum]|uniref:Uncharacterized protein n=1 Tax=Penicillium expansum TaxID=27334 RepID=A0A0A2JPV1_PENEN|nr:hypothetical protein PEX2_001040 [Penicillium expansum]KGO43345.1 hypothetical protein PEXP_096360 [Penicillium expansum]KGO57429.1 hypothetical protein PEX2_001040 [Penicillium expansum]KGO62133.1 hypothetical protein PEX1_066460 [Penicillium expansum]
MGQADIILEFSILWRTEYDGYLLAGISGSTLCLGQISNQTCLAVFFQNFETHLYSRAYLREDHRDPPPEDASKPTITGGFSLPSEVRQTEIICGDSKTFAAPGNFG